MKNSWNCEVRQNLFTKSCLTNNYLSCDPHYVILAWIQIWNMFEKLMKECSPPEFFHKDMSHEQLIFTWSTFRDSSMGTKLNIFEKLIKVFSPPEFFHRNMSLEQLLSTWSTLRDSSMGTKFKYFWKTHETVNLPEFIHFTGSWVFQKYFNFVPIVESRER